MRFVREPTHHKLVVLADSWAASRFLTCATSLLLTAMYRTMLTAIRFSIVDSIVDV